MAYLNKDGVKISSIIVAKKSVTIFFSPKFYYKLSLHTHVTQSDNSKTVYPPLRQSRDINILLSNTCLVPVLQTLGKLEKLKDLNMSDQMQ